MALSLISKSRGHRIDGVASKQQNLLHILAKESVGQQSNKVIVKGFWPDCSPKNYNSQMSISYQNDEYFLQFYIEPKSLTHGVTTSMCAVLLARLFP